MADTNFLAIWRAGSGTQWWSTGLNFNDFKAKDLAHFNQGLRLISLHNHGGSYTGVWHPGSGAQWWAAGLNFNDFKAAGRVIFSGWDWWSGNTIIISHDSGGLQDAFRTIYMHLRNGPTHDADQAWKVTVGNLSEPGKTQYKNYLKSTGCPQGGPYNPKADFWGTDADKIDANIVGKHVNAGDKIAQAGCTGPGGCGCTDPSPTWTWGGGVNTHLHIFFARRDPTDNEWYSLIPTESTPRAVATRPSTPPSPRRAPDTTSCGREEKPSIRDRRQLLR